jgi:hypothetical protein
MSLLQMLVLVVSPVLVVLVPGVLLSAAILFLLLGFGIYLGFVWTRELDTLAGHHDSRDVFIVYFVVLAVCYVVYTLSDINQVHRTDSMVRSTIKRSIEKLRSEWPKFVEERDEQRNEKGKRERFKYNS